MLLHLPFQGFLQCSNFDIDNPPVIEALASNRLLKAVAERHITEVGDMGEGESIPRLSIVLF